MSFDLQSVVPWGRSGEEYLRMFALTEADLRGRILDCAGGPASFNADMRSWPSLAPPCSGVTVVADAMPR